MVHLEIKPGSQPYHAKPYAVPKCYEATIKLEVDRLCNIGVLKKINDSEWAAPSFIVPKKDNTVGFVSDFRTLNQKIKRKPYPLPKLQDLMLNLEGFQSGTYLDLNVGYYHILLDEEAQRQCMISFHGVNMNIYDYQWAYVIVQIYSKRKCRI